jgi:hypothetical protein
MGRTERVSSIYGRSRLICSIKRGRIQILGLACVREGDLAPPFIKGEIKNFAFRNFASLHSTDGLGRPPLPLDRETREGGGCRMPVASAPRPHSRRKCKHSKISPFVPILNGRRRSGDKLDSVPLPPTTCNTPSSCLRSFSAGSWWSTRPLRCHTPFDTTRSHVAPSNIAPTLVNPLKTATVSFISIIIIPHSYKNIPCRIIKRSSPYSMDISPLLTPLRALPLQTATRNNRSICRCLV